MSGRNPQIDVERTRALRRLTERLQYRQHGPFIRANKPACGCYSFDGK